MTNTIEVIYRAHTATGYAEFRSQAEAEVYLAEVQAAEQPIDQQPTE